MAKIGQIVSVAEEGKEGNMLTLLTNPLNNRLNGCWVTLCTIEGDSFKGGICYHLTVDIRKKATGPQNITFRLVDTTESNYSYNKYIKLKTVVVENNKKVHLVFTPTQDFQALGIELIAESHTEGADLTIQGCTIANLIDDNTILEHVGIQSSQSFFLSVINGEPIYTGTSYYIETPPEYLINFVGVSLLNQNKNFIIDYKVKE